MTATATSVDDDAEPPVRSRRERRRTGAGAMHALGQGRRIAAGLRSGLTEAGCRSTARRLRRLLAADAVALADLRGELAWSGQRRSRSPARAERLAEEVLRTDSRAGSNGVLALPLRVRDELVGVLVVVGPVPSRAAGEAATWIGDAVERSRLEASADAAEQAELRALRAEISPHFVYNALTTIASFVQDDPDRVHDLLLDFAEYTRHSHARRGDYTTLAEEFRSIEAYLALARAVLGERLRVQIRVAPEVLPVAVPFLVLQPVVENAVRHGVELAPGRQGLVQVSGEANGPDCVICVEDDGPGMAPEHARALLAGQGHGVGLVNVDRRLRAVFGAASGLVIETAPEAGTKVTLRLPRFQPGVVAS